MNRSAEGIYFGEVVHKRLRPVMHALRYRVFALMCDCDQLTELDKRLKLFSYNHFNLFSLFDRDHGDGTALDAYLRKVAAGSAVGDQISRFSMLCYPRIFGYAFNPLTVYFGFDHDHQVRLVIYEVNNTFGERMTYALPAGPERAGVMTQSCRKQLYVSPFNSDKGTYSFHVTDPGEDLTLGVALRDNAGPLLKAYFHASREPLSDKVLLKALARTGWMTVKVIAGIHLEAAKLWLKGLRLVHRPTPPANPISYGSTKRESV
jgi:DUF1365 family protein